MPPALKGRKRANHKFLDILIMKLPDTFIKNSDNINVIIETPKGCGNKYAYDFKMDLFKLSKILPEGLAFPHHFGFIPRTKGEDGQPLDVIVFMDEPSYPGCLVECKVLGVIEAEETEKGKTIRNDRIIAATLISSRYKELDSINKIEKETLLGLVNFFISYNNLSDKDFKPLRHRGPKHTIKLIKKQEK
jgi:inorganic pyrophosphatase